MPDHAGMLIASIVRKIEERSRGIHDIMPAEPEAPRHIAIFSSLAQMEIWLFCSGFPFSLYDWARRHESLHHRKPNQDWLKTPDAVALDENGQLPMDVFMKINHGLSSAKSRAGACRICWGTGWARVIKGILLPESTSIPGLLVSTPCWCRKMVKEE